MTGLEKIIGEIQSESENNVSLIIKRAEKEAEKIIESAAKEAEKAAGAIENEAAEEEKDILARAKSAGELAVRRAVLLKKREIIDNIIEEARERLVSLPDDEYFELLEKMLDKYAHNEEGKILICKKDASRMPQSFKDKLKTKKLTISDKTINESGGFLLIYGDIEEKCTFDALIDGEGDKLTDIVLKTVFD